jgi:hypothetical protein
VAPISVGSVEVDVVPNTQGIRSRLRDALVPAATQAGGEAGRAAGQAFGPAMQGAVGDAIGTRIGEQIGRQIAARITATIRDSIRTGITQGGRTAVPAATRQGDQTGGAFSRALKARLEAAFQSLPRADVRLSSTGFDADMARLRARIETLSGKRIGIDVDVAAAMAEITDIEARLRRLGSEHPNVQVRADTAAALAQLAAVRAAVDDVDRRHVDIDALTATNGFRALTAAALLFGPAILPVLPAVAAGLGAIVAAAAAAGAGLGAVALVAVPAFKQIGSVLQAHKAAQDAATNATLRGGQAASQAVRQSLQMASAQQSLAQAERNGARQVAQAQQQVGQARQAAADAVAQAAVRNEQAARRVQDAERSLADAQRDARRAQDDLTTARRTAVQELEDLNNKLADSVLSQRDAEIALKEATLQRDAVLKNAKSTELDKQKALLAYDQAVQRLKEQTTETTRLKGETAAANKAGVEGSATVKAAQDRLAEAQRKVADQTQAVRDAQVEAARTQVETSRQVAEAQQRVSEATANVAVAQQNAADAVSSAQRQIESASLSAAGTVDQAAIAQQKYQDELAKLTPAARQTMAAYLGLKDAFSAWSKSLQPAVMPIFTRALNGMKNALPGLIPFALQAAGAIQTLMDKMSAQLKTPFWKGFKDDLVKSVRPAVIGLGVAFGNVFKGMAGIIDAFFPHMDSISSRMQTMTGRFADWGKNLKGSPEFERFLSYSSEMGPKVWQTFKDIVGAIFAIGSALSPISSMMLGIISQTAQGIQWIADHAPWVIQTIYGITLAFTAWRLAMMVWRGATMLASAAMAAFNLISLAGPWGWIVLAIVGVVAAVYFLYTKVSWFRDAVDAVWQGIKDAGQAIKDWFAGDFVRFFTKTLPGAFQFLLDWVGRNWPWIVGALGGPMGLAVVYVIKHWDSIRSGISGAWEAIKRNTLYPIRDFFTKTIPDWGRTLRDGVVNGFKQAADGAKKAWDKLKDYAKAPVQYVVDVTYNNGLRRVWNLVTDAFGGKHLDPLKFASGGVLPGYTPGRDVHQFLSPTGGALALSGGEAIMRPEWTRAVGPGFVNAMNAAARTGGVSGVRSALGFKDGGIFSGIGSVLSGAWDKVKKGASWLKDTFSGAVQAGVTHVVNPLIDKIPGGNVGFVRLIKDMMKSAVARLVGAGKKGDEQSVASIGGVIPKGNRLAVINQALAAAHIPPPGTLQQWQAGLNTLITRESGWTPRAINRWDSNAKAGHPSQGLAQTIPSTWSAYVPASLRSKGILDPVSNVAAAARYIVARYHNITNVQQANANRPPAGYDSGGYLQPGLNLAYNGTGRPEPVFTTAQANALTSLAGRGLDAGPSRFEGDLYLDSGEFLGRVRGEAQQVMQQGQRELMAVINAS